jgi:hypothetical protein
MDRRNLILGGVAVLLLVVAVGYYVSRPSASAELPRETKVSGACLECRQHVQVVADLRAPRPFECPRCDARAVYPLFLCRDCGKHSVPKLERRGDAELPKIPIMPSCLSCGSVNVGNYLGTEIIPAGELVLPDWPQ